MAIDYVKLAATAKRLIDANGRSLTVRKLDRTIDDPSKPWRGTASPRAVPDTEVSIKGVFVHPDSAIELGIRTLTPDVMAMIEEVAIVEASSTAEELEYFDEVVDGSEIYKIEKAQLLKPGTVRLIYFLFLKK